MTWARLDFGTERDLTELCAAVEDSGLDVRRVDGDFLDRFVDRRTKIARSVAGSTEHADTVIRSAKRVARKYAPGVEYTLFHDQQEYPIRVTRFWIDLRFPPDVRDLVELLVRSLRPDEFIETDD